MTLGQACTCWSFTSPTTSGPAAAPPSPCVCLTRHAQGAWHRAAQPPLPRRCAPRCGSRRRNGQLPRAAAVFALELQHVQGVVTPAVSVLRCSARGGRGCATTSERTENPLCILVTNARARGLSHVLQRSGAASLRHVCAQLHAHEQRPRMVKERLPHVALQCAGWAAVAVQISQPLARHARHVTQKPRRHTALHLRVLEMGEGVVCQLPREGGQPGRAAAARGWRVRKPACANFCT